jgi:hypothetical protein
MSDSFDPSAPPPVNVGFERPMEDFAAPPPDAPPIETDGLVEASEELANRRRAEIEPASVQYMEPDGTRQDSDLSVTPERAARDLSDFRNRVDDARTAQQAEIDATSIDLLRNERATGLTVEQQIHLAEEAAQQQAQAAQQQAQQPVEQQPQQHELPEGVDPEVARVLTEHPKVRQALEAEVGRIHQAEQAHYAALQENAKAAFNTLLVNFPELQHISNADELKVGIKLINQQNPARAQAIISHIGKVQELGRQAEQAQAAMQQRAEQQYAKDFEAYCRAEDAKFSKMAPELTDPATNAKVGNAAMQTLKTAGYTDDEIQRAWSGRASISLRDARAQALLLKAAKYDLAQEAVRYPAPRPIPPVQKPGVTTNHANFDDRQLGALNARLAQSGSFKDAAKLLMARRSQRGGG